MISQGSMSNGAGPFLSVMGISVPGPAASGATDPAGTFAMMAASFDIDNKVTKPLMAVARPGKGPKGQAKGATSKCNGKGSNAPLCY